MLVYFRVKNYRSIADEMVLQLDAEKRIHDYPENLIETPHGQFLKSLVIYGANASGKTNLLSAINLFQTLVLFSAQNNSKEELGAHPFLLDDRLATSPTLFEINLLENDVFYRYGFEYTAKEVVSEWLFWTDPQTGREKELFTREREAEKFHYAPSYRGKKIQREEVLSNTLLLSRLDQMNVEVAKKVLSAIFQISVLSGLPSTRVGWAFSARRLKTEAFKHGITALTRLADSSIEDLFTRQRPEEDEPSENREIFEQGSRSPTKRVREQDVLAVKKKVDGQGKVEFSLEHDESAGTWSMFRFAGIFLDVLSSGTTLIVDELEASLHPLLTRYIVKMFNSAEMNPKGAQLIFVTHNTSLLAYGDLRKEQVIFCEKDDRGMSHFYALSEFNDTDLKKAIKSSGKGVPKMTLEQRYIEGRYGAIPFLDDFSLSLANLIKTDSERV